MAVTAVTRSNQSHKEESVAPMVGRLLLLYGFLLEAEIDRRRPLVIVAMMCRHRVV